MTAKSANRNGRRVGSGGNRPRHRSMTELATAVRATLRVAVCFDCPDFRRRWCAASRRVAMVVAQQSAGAHASNHGCCDEMVVVGRREQHVLQALMASLRVIVRHVLVANVTQVASAEWDNLRQTFLADGPNESLRIGIGVWTT